MHMDFKRLLSLSSYIQPNFHRQRGTYKFGIENFKLSLMAKPVVHVNCNIGSIFVM